MTCEWVEQHLSALHDDALDSATAAQVREHVATCAHCAAILADYARFDALLARAPRVAPSAALRDRIFTSPAFREIAQSQSQNGSSVPTSTKTPTKPTPTRHMPQAARVWITVLALLFLISGGSVAIGRILASRNTGPTYVTCPHALASGNRIVFQVGDRLRSNSDALICDTHTRVALWQASPNGQWIAYTDATTNTLRLVRADATQDHEIDTDAGTVAALSWSPDSQTLLIVTATQHQTSATTLTIWHASTTATTATPMDKPIPQASLALPPAWSADSQSVALALTTSATPGIQASIVVFGAHIPVAQFTASTRDLATISLAEPVQSLGWTPGDAPALTWATGMAGHPTTIGAQGRVDIGSNTNTSVIPLKDAVAAAFSAASGQWAVASSSGTIAQIDAVSGQKTPLAQIGPVAQLAWAPNGGQVAVVSNSTLWLVSATGATKVGAIDATSALAWNPYSTLLAYVSGGTARIYSLVTGKAVPAAAQGTGTITGLLWSPDGQLLAIWGSQGIALDSPAGMTANALTVPPADAPQWSTVP